MLPSGGLFRFYPLIVFVRSQVETPPGSKHFCVANTFASSGCRFLVVCWYHSGSFGCSSDSFVGNPVKCGSLGSVKRCYAAGHLRVVCSNKIVILQCSDARYASGERREVLIRGTDGLRDRRVRPRDAQYASGILNTGPLVQSTTLCRPSRLLGGYLERHIPACRH